MWIRAVTRFPCKNPNSKKRKLGVPLRHFHSMTEAARTTIENKDDMLVGAPNASGQYGIPQVLLLGWPRKRLRSSLTREEREKKDEPDHRGDTPVHRAVGARQPQPRVDRAPIATARSARAQHDRAANARSRQTRPRGDRALYTTAR